MRTSATDYTDDTDRTYELLLGLAMPDAVAAPEKPSTRSSPRTQSDAVFLCELGALCGESFEQFFLRSFLL